MLLTKFPQKRCVSAMLAAGFVAVVLAIGPLAAQVGESSDESAAALSAQDSSQRPQSKLNRGAPIVLRIGTWNLDGSVPLRLLRRFQRPKNVWRTTFGPRKTAVDGPNSKLPKIDADVMAVQSVTDIRVLRRLFPARDYYIVVSRQLLNLRREGQNRAKGLAKPQRGTTAVIIRRGAGIRMMRQEQLLGFAGTMVQTPNLPPRSAAVAVGLVRSGRRLWLLSVNLNWGCTSEKPMAAASAVAAASKADSNSVSNSASKATSKATCKTLPHQVRAHQLRLLRTWLKNKRAMGDTVVVAGSFGQELASADSVARGADLERALDLAAYSVRSIVQSDSDALAAPHSPALAKRNGGKSTNDKRCGERNVASHDGFLVHENSRHSAVEGPLPLPRLGPTGRAINIAGAKHCPLLLDLMF